MKPSELIRRYGWVQGRLGNQECGFCLMEAMFVCQCSDAEHIRVKSIVGHRAEWNDTPGRTKDEVLALLEAEGL